MAMRFSVIDCAAVVRSVGECTAPRSTVTCDATTVGSQAIETTITCSNGSLTVTTDLISCSPTCPGKSKSIDFD